MAFNFSLRAATVPAGQSCLTNVQGVLDAAAKYLEVQGPSGITGTIVSKDQPATEDEDKVWVKLDVNGKPEGIYIFSTDAWVRIPEAEKGALRVYSGTVAAIPTGWKLSNGVAPSTKNTTSVTGVWTPNYSGAVSSYVLAIIEYVGP
jgi:hypothetical protein